MTKTKIAITIDKNTLLQLDHLVANQGYPSRSLAIQEALDEKLEKITKNRLARECLKLDYALEKKLAEEGISEEVKQWPEY